jgi:hypothetical protein
MAEHTTLVELRTELREALGAALEAVDSIRCRLEVIKTGILGQTIQAGERYAEVENAQDVAERISILIRKALEGELKPHDGAGLDDYPLEEMGGWACHDDAETEGDRRYHEAKDEGRLK